jgi:hypothetical protein
VTIEVPVSPVSQWRVLWFSPNAGLWETSQLEHDLANGLVSQGAEVTVIRCRGLFDSLCPTIQANGLQVTASNSQKKSICKECKSSEASFHSVAKYSTVWIDDYLTETKRNQVVNEVGYVTRANWQEFGNHPFPINRHATYLSMLHHKVPDITSTEIAWNEYLSDLTNSLFAYHALPQIFIEKNPTHCFVYNPLYPTNRVFTELVLTDSDIQYVGLSTGAFVADRYSTIALYRSIQSSQTAVDSQRLMDSLEIPLTHLEVKLVARNLGHLIQGRDPWVYSTAPTFKSTEEIHDQLGTSGRKPIAIVLIGSPDETRSSALVGAEFERVPIDQVSSVTEFIEQSLLAARNLPNVEFVFRLHPRLAPNKRESLRSPDLDRIEELLEQRTSNVFINSPDDGIGLYDVARVASIGINHASSAGLEFLSLGIPVVHYDPPRLNAYPASLGLEVERFDADGYSAKINQAITTPRSTELAIKAWRWYSITLARAITHRTWQHQPENVDAGDSKQSLSAIRKVIPVAWREKISRKLSLRDKARRTQSDSMKTQSQDWIVECIERISDFDSSTVWNPLAIVRGDSLAQDQEKLEIANQIIKIDRLIGRLANEIG